MSLTLVTGASGRVGGSALAALRRGGAPVVAAHRPGSARRPPGPVRGLDFLRPETWDGALAGVRRLFLVRPPAIADVDATLNAFVDRGAPHLEHVVFLSVAGAERNRIIPHARVERHLRQAGPDGPAWTFLRAGFFSQNLCDAYLEDIRDDDRIHVPSGSARVAWVDTRDVGEAGARALLDPGSRGAAWTLTGAEARSFSEVAHLLTDVLGRTITYEAASIPGYVWHLTRRRGRGWGRALVQTVLHVALRFGIEARVDPTLASVLGRRPRSIAETIADHRHLWSQ